MNNLTLNCEENKKIEISEKDNIFSIKVFTEQNFITANITKTQFEIMSNYFNKGE